MSEEEIADRPPVVPVVGHEVVQVVMHELMLPWLKRMLDERGMHLYKMPIGDDLPTYGVGLGPEGE